MNQQNLRFSRSVTAALFFLFITYVVVLLRTAYVNEDAYITMRTVDNFIHGYGMRWNVSERVQTFTHPLWCFLVTAFYFFTREAFYTLIGLSLAISFAAFYIAIIQVREHNLATLAAAAILFFSKAFVDFSTSGLENPATHLLLACFLLLFLRNAGNDTFDGRTVFLLSLISGLAALNRMDTFLFFVPVLLMVLIKGWKSGALKNVLLGLLPFIAWEVFSVIYYGFPFPNTAYAKLYTGLTRIDLVEEGFIYILNSLNWDPITLLTVFAGTGLTFLRGSWREKSIAAGVLLYIFYLIWIGGDYMSGRFFSGALLVSVILLARQLVQVELTEGLVISALIVAAAYASPTPMLTSVSEETYSTGRTDVNGIYDLRSYYFQTSGLLYIRNGYPEPYHEWVFRGLKFKEDRKRYLIEGTIGYTGYFAGPDLFIIDPNALSDPLLARLKPVEKTTWIPGHFERAVPNGYLETLRTGSNQFEDQQLGEYYEKLSLIIRGPIFSWGRFTAIWKMNTGQYDYLLEEYEKRQKETVTP